MLIFLFLPSLPLWLAITLPVLAYVSWLDLRDLGLRPIVVFWWILFVLILYIPGWIVLKAWVIHRRRQDRQAT
ncbi:MAG: hypothetical protein ACKO7U_04335 [Actinomycetota bacterium]|nr:hypothetical protein [Actinomycetota bacterium]